jgi:hypothetical protein
MKKEYIIGGLAIVGGLSLLAYLTSKSRRNSEGFLEAVGSGAGDTKPIRAFWGMNNGVCTLYVSGMNPDGTKAFFKSASDGTNSYTLLPIGGAEFFASRQLPKCSMSASNTRA